MSNAIKDLSAFSSSPIGFKVEWHSSLSDKWYQSQGHEFESWECYCKRGIVGGAIIWYPTTTLKTGLGGVMSNIIKDLSMFFPSPIGFEVEWYNSRSDNKPCCLLSVWVVQTINHISSFYHWNDDKNQNENLLKNSRTKLKIFKTKRPNENKPK